MEKKIFGYARVSTDKQELARQLKLLTEYGVTEENLYTDKFTGRSFTRDGFRHLCSVLREGDTVVVESLSRVGRTAKELLEVLEKWQNEGVVFISLKEKIDLSTPTGKLITQIICSMAEFEADCIRERVREGIAVAREAGRVGGRPKVDSRKTDKAMKLYRAKTHSIKEICEICGISTATLYRALKKEANTNE